MAVEKLDRSTNMASCRMIVEGGIDRDIVCQVPVTRLGPAAKKTLGAADKRLVSGWYQDGEYCRCVYDLVFRFVLSFCLE